MISETFGLGLVLALALIGTLVMLLRLRRIKRKRWKLERDATGFWRYHKQTQFELKHALHPLKRRKGQEPTKTAAVIHFDGDIKARQHRQLAQLVDEVIINHEQVSEVVIVINSAGGMVSQYGHAFSQVERLRESGIPVTACIDVVAASGGYLMSLPANRIVAAPFAAVGSVGVVAFVPNLRRMLQNWLIEPRTFTAGRYKRTVTLTDDAGPEEVARFQRQLESVHDLFLSALKRYRPAAKLEEIETGEHWTARESVDRALGLIDQIGTSADYLLKLNQERPLLLISHRKRLFEEGLAIFADKMVEAVGWGRAA